ncbi:hypothetical protein FSP39_022919 [Pinctada imbricata]|uniref:Kynurenine formamidase n=1 Tax=Pinctada imbricata TaxID=66713 RepID=A0AA88YNA3_PINIB|nr:hypothetical protein FSP39_022919 [Pinctada imbricata]
MVFSSRRGTFVLLSCIVLGLKFGDGLQVVDLTHKQGPSTIYWPGNPEFNFTILSRQQYANYWYESNYFGTAEHGGTHLDSPAHFYKDKSRTDELSMDKLYGPGVIISVVAKARENPDYQVMINDIRNWEEEHGRIPNGAAIIMNSGWHKKYPNKEEVFNSTTPNDPSTFHFPGWHENTTQWLVTNRNPNLIGVDTPSTDYGQSKTFPTHVILGGNNIPGLENVANLDAIPASGTVIFAAVVKLEDGSGGPARIFAVSGDMFPTSSSYQNAPPPIFIILISVFLLFLL